MFRLGFGSGLRHIGRVLIPSFLLYYLSLWALRITYKHLQVAKKRQHVEHEVRAVCSLPPPHTHIPPAAWKSPEISDDLTQCHFLLVLCGVSTSLNFIMDANEADRSMPWVGPSALCPGWLFSPLCPIFLWAHALSDLPFPLRGCCSSLWGAPASRGDRGQIVARAGGKAPDHSSLAMLEKCADRVLSIIEVGGKGNLLPVPLTEMQVAFLGQRRKIPLKLEFVPLEVEKVYQL